MSLVSGERVVSSALLPAAAGDRLIAPAIADAPRSGSGDDSRRAESLSAYGRDDLLRKGQRRLGDSVIRYLLLSRLCSHRLEL